VQEIEEKIGGGLLEEVIQVAEGERRLVDTMIENKVYVSSFCFTIYRQCEG
jgi:hypothetical protein